ncbi:hypothetical protein AVEN_223704-1 [Araneus ventricosus]|uniref:Uncharacterized protein n=1 Tax=Araneus ventricosus TaxID=182803 RepID=A0A4Y2KLR1_ARAVE|nr:hypothetical protein AVEN_223704-1 [Araneus ventricosus]
MFNLTLLKIPIKEKVESWLNLEFFQIVTHSFMHPQNNSDCRKISGRVIYVKSGLCLMDANVRPHRAKLVFNYFEDQVQEQCFSTVADWSGCQLARWQVGPLRHKSIWALRMCMYQRERKGFFF